MGDEKTLHLAITMAGAISAGAYTAGVMDYLFEVLDKWEEMKKKPETKDKVPNHNIKIEVLSGASAGGITAAIASFVLQRREKHPARAFNAAEADQNRLKKNSFYDAWVNLTKDDMTDELLKDKDAVTLPDDATSCISAFNSNFITAVAERTLPEKSVGLSLKNSVYAAENLRLFVTLTNLTGFSRETRMNAETPDASRFVTQDHRDLALFRFDQPAVEEKDGSIEVNLESGKNVDILRNAAVATGAFPLGLAYKSLRRDKTHLDDNVLLKELYGTQTRFDVPKEYRATFVDGGLINNEPFELTEVLLQRQIAGQPCPYDSENFNSTILMIDPFPSDVLLPVESEKSEFPYNFSQTVAKFLSSVRTQVLVKTDLLNAAFDEKDFRCFVMSPRRREYVGDEPNFFNGAKAIASGTLGGFGGFLEKEFREHDFFLGRINCKSFLQNHFKYPADTENPIFKNAYPPEIENDFLIEGDKGERFLPIIPDVNKINEPKDAVEKIYRNLKFPSIAPKQLEKRFDNLNPKIVRRIKFFIETNFVDFKTRFFLKAALFFLKKKLLGEIFRIIRKDLKEWKILRDK